LFLKDCSFRRSVSFDFAVYQSTQPCGSTISCFSLIGCPSLVCFLQYDLVNTIGEAAALGAAGIVSWGDMDVTETEDSCFAARHHLEQVMNPYILNVSTSTRLCSEALCQGRGRCVRKRWDDDVYLHLDPCRYRIERQLPRGSRHWGPLTVRGGLSQDDVNYFDRNFDCMCYSGTPCRSLMMFNDVPAAVVRERNGGAHRPRPLLLLTMVLSLKYVVMRS
ncbi:hyaluronidase PH-20-like, partial [Anarrhichthys ocellatus]|uniref:hyaluronidase PH-20-like n=1 Tax=Anarrhichthys ocellatus TaxID=433405 RepID=UPI0012EE323B